MFKLCFWLATFSAKQKKNTFASNGVDFNVFFYLLCFSSALLFQGRSSLNGKSWNRSAVRHIDGKRQWKRVPKTNSMLNVWQVSSKKYELFHVCCVVFVTFFELAKMNNIYQSWLLLVAHKTCIIQFKHSLFFSFSFCFCFFIYLFIFNEFVKNKPSCWHVSAECVIGSGSLLSSELL